MHGSDIRIARIFNAYGPGMPGSDGRVVSNFISAAMEDNGTIDITGDGSAVRCFQYISDCVAGLTRLMESDYLKPMNIGNDIPCRIGDLANMVADLVASTGSSRPTITYHPKPIDDPIMRQPDISLAKDVLQWTPSVSLEEGLQRTVSWFYSISNQDIQAKRDPMTDTTEKTHLPKEILVPFSKPFIAETETSNIRAAMRENQLSGGGTFSKRCQETLQQRLGSLSVILTASGTSALEVAALTLDIKPGDEIILPSYTFVSTANAFVLRGASLVFVDIRPDTMNIDESKIEAAITDRTKVIVPVHYAGVACEMDSIMSIAAKHGIVVIEDAAQGILSKYKGRPLGSIGHIGCMSFHESKNITSGGQGGAVFINDKSLVARAELVSEKGTDRIQLLRGKQSSYHWQCIGSGSDMSEIQAAYLWSQLEALEMITDKRLSLWCRYHELLQPMSKQGQIVLPTIPTGVQHNAHIYFVRVRTALEREAAMSFMRRRGIVASAHYKPLHASAPGTAMGRFIGSDEFTTQESAKLIRLPLFHEMTEEAQNSVVGALRAFCETKSMARL
ncbi:hypothetical protein BP6252_11396 [Coleophoma cylindrospora]|uniref:NAD(P)-binding domain-containing protein n=1 Tax=Coleophoma cylindrospora TaxID=1849047 RepID=A0A3D8QJH2_9HELO|nr:hypothetical protein BP6252_11396 [Coleophoma cylindrospora]